MKNIIFFLLVILIISSCYKEVTIGEQLDHEPKLYIECILYPGETPVLYLSQSHPFFGEKVTPQQTFVRNATVEISSDDWHETLRIDSTFDKFRCRWTPHYAGNNSIEQNKTYHLKVTHQGNTYNATTSIDQAKVNLDSVIYTPEFFDLYGGHDGVVLYFKDAQEEVNFYRFQMDRWIDSSRYHAHSLDLVKSDCVVEGELYLTQDYGRNIINDGANDGKQISFNAEVSFEYLEGDTATVYLLSLDTESAKFFKDLDEQLQSILNPFVEPTFIHSTIDGTLGVFGSAVRSDPVHFVYPQDNP